MTFQFNSMAEFCGFDLHVYVSLLVYLFTKLIRGNFIFIFTPAPVGLESWIRPLYWFQLASFSKVVHYLGSLGAQKLLLQLYVEFAAPQK